MRMIDLITKKRDGGSLGESEIRFFIDGCASGAIPDYQLAALLMAITLNGMNRAETAAMTLAMAESGDMLDLSDITDYAVDKHSSGGIGDKTSLVVLPLVAAFGVPIAKMSGRGLGFSGGTLDKLESISGFNVNLSDAEFRRIARETGVVIAGQSASLAPADGLLYALRDVTATVESVPLIASSIMSKKLAAGASGIVLDVKAGRGAFMKTVDEARSLASAMVQIGVDAGRDMVALLSNMAQPLGYAAGNALEVAEAVRTLQGGGPGDFRAHCIAVAAQMLRLAGRGQRWQELDSSRPELERMLDGGAAFERFVAMTRAQGGDSAQLEDLSKLPQARLRRDVLARRGGWVAAVLAEKVGWATLALGAGRTRKGEAINHAVGVEVWAKVGDKIALDDPFLTIHADDEASLGAAMEALEGAIQFSESPVAPLPLFHGLVDGADL